MKKFLSLILLTCILFISPTPASAEFFSDVILTSSNAIWTDSRAYSTLQDALDAVGSKEREIVVAKEEICTSLTIPSNIHLKFTKSGSITNLGQLTINTKNITAPSQQIFTGSGDIDFANGTVLKSSWFADLPTCFDITNDDYVTVVIDRGWDAHVNANCSVGDNVTLKWESSTNRIVIDSGFTLSNIKNIEAGNFQIFSGNGDLDFLDGTELKLNWFPRLRSVLNWVESEEVTIVVNEDSPVDYSDTVASNEAIKVVPGGCLSISAGVTLTINGPFEAGLYQVFSGDGSVSFGDGAVKEVYPQWWGENTTPGTTDMTERIQKAIDSISGEGVIFLGSEDYALSSSGLSETYYNSGASVTADTGCLILRDGIHLVGSGEGTVLKPADPADTAIYVVAYEDAGVHNLKIDSSWVATDAGHGIFQVYKTDVADATISNLTFENLWIVNVGGYAVGLQNGTFENVHLRNLRSKNTGADGIDIKNRGTSEDSKGVFLENIYIESFGQRLDGQAGIDIRGICTINNIQVVDVGRSTVSQTGIRFRTSGGAGTEQWARRSSLTGFYIRGDAAIATLYGITVGSSDVSILGGVIEDCNDGIVVAGNANESADRVSVIGISVDNADNEAFSSTTGGDFVKFIGCTVRDSLTGFRIEGDNNSVIGCDAVNCSTDLSLSTAAAASVITIGNHFDEDFAVFDSPTTGRAGVAVKGSSTDIDLELQPKGTGHLRIGYADAAASVPGNFAADRILEVKTSDGTILYIPAMDSAW